MAPTRMMAVAAVAATALALVLVVPQAAFAQWESPNSFKPGVQPSAVAVDSSTNTVYVAGNGDKGIRAVNGTTQKTVATYKVSHSIQDLATDPVNHYVAAAGHFGLAIVNETTKVVTQKSWAYDANGVGIDPGTGLVFLGGSDEDGNDYVSFFSETTGALVQTVSVTDGITQIAVDTTTHLVYVVGYNSGDVSVINESNYEVGEISAASGDCSDLYGGCGPSGIAVDSATGMLYVSNSEGVDGPGYDFISVINTATDEVVSEIPVLTAASEDLDEPGSMAVDDTTNTVFSVGDGPAIVINGATGTVIRDVALAKHSFDVQDATVAVDSATGVAYVASDQLSSSGSVYIVADVLPTLSSSTPKISGDATVDDVLTATAGTWTAGAALTYQWKANGTAVASGGTSTTYTVHPADVGKKITVSVTGTRSGYTTRTVTSKSTSDVASIPFTTAPVPTIGGTATVGSTLTASAGSWSPGATFTYRWYRSGSTIAGAVASTYQLTSSDRGRKITVGVYGHALGYTTTKRTSLATASIGYGTLITATPTITGSPAVGQKLTAVPGVWGPAKVTLSYSWYLNGKVIKHETSSTLKLGKSAGGGTITVKVHGSKSGYTSETEASTGLVIPAG